MFVTVNANGYARVTMSLRQLIYPLLLFHAKESDGALVCLLNNGGREITRLNYLSASEAFQDDIFMVV